MAILVIAVSSLITILTTAAQLYSDYLRDVRQINEVFQVLRGSHLPSLIKNVWLDDDDQILLQLNGLARLPEMEFLEIKVDDKVRWRSGAPVSKYQIANIFPLNYMYKDKVQDIGTLTAVASLDDVYERLWDKFLTVLVTNAFKTFIVAGFMLFIFHRLVGQHLLTISDYIGSVKVKENISPLRLSKKQPIEGNNDELDDVVDAINRTSKLIEKYIAEIHVSESELHASQQYLQTFLDRVPALVSIKDLDGNYLLMNEQYLTKYGINNVVEEGSRASKFFPKDVAAEFASQEQLVVEKKGEVTEEHSIQHEGKTRVHLCTKFPIMGSSGEIEAIGTISADITDRKLLDERFRSAFEHITAGCIIIDAEGTIQTYNNACQGIFGYLPHEVIGQNVKMLMPASYSNDHDSYIENYLETGDAKIIGSGREVSGLRKNGEEFPLHLGVGEMEFGGGIGFIGTIIDLTEQNALEEQLRQAQRMEAVGQLTGGVAHDFNNLLGIMIGNAEMLERIVHDNPKAQAKTKAIKKAVERAASLTSRLLAFSRQQTLLPKPTDVAKLISSLEDMLRRTLGETIDLILKTNQDLRTALVDSHQLENALINLTLNARDAMPDGGYLTIETSNATLDETYVEQHEDLAPGEYVRIAVSDSGTGMTPEVEKKAFEPFFTTKEVGEGSGLGLSMVFGLIKQSNGHISVFTRTGRGTTFSLYLPTSKEDIKDKESELSPPPPVLERKMILLVEDDPDVRETTASILRDLGYQVFEAGDGPSALKKLEVLKSQGIAVDVLLSDVVMPHQMSGVELAEEIEIQYKDMKILLTSGYLDKIADQEELKAKGFVLISKPYKRAELIAAIEEVTTH